MLTSRDETFANMSSNARQQTARDLLRHLERFGKKWHRLRTVGGSDGLPAPSMSPVASREVLDEYLPEVGHDTGISKASADTPTMFTSSAGTVPDLERPKIRDAVVSPMLKLTPRELQLAFSRRDNLQVHWVR